MRIDTHVHSTHSDGRSSVDEIFSLAKKINLDVVALTDHDTNVGWGQANSCVDKYGVGFIPGSEISTIFNGQAYHLLAYLYDGDEPVLQNILSKSKDARFERFIRMFENLSKDYDISLSDFLVYVQGMNFTDALVNNDFSVHDVLKNSGLPLGRPHLADVLIKAGYFENREQCFDTVLHPCEKYYVPYSPANILDVLRAVNNAGGFTVLAHAFSKKRGKSLKYDDILLLKNHGLGGLEVNHYEHDLKDRQKAYELSCRLGLLQFGSSDYHGSGKPNKLGENTTRVDTILQMEAKTFGKVRWGWIK